MTQMMKALSIGSKPTWGDRVVIEDKSTPDSAAKMPAMTSTWTKTLADRHTHQKCGVPVLGGCADRTAHACACQEPRHHSHDRDRDDDDQHVLPGNIYVAEPEPVFQRERLGKRVTSEDLQDAVLKCDR